jgi:hypothetical protein
MNLRSQGATTRFFPCLYCGVDSGPALTFFIWLIGAGLLGFVSFLVWGRLSGKFSNEESSAQIPLDIESNKENEP